MAQTRRGAVSRNTGTNRINRGAAARGTLYVYDNTARDFDVRRELEEEPRRQLSREARKNRDKAHHMNVGYVMFLMAALCVCAMVLINYVQLQSKITDKVKTIAGMESKLNNMQLENEENYNKIVSSVDLEEIKKVAIGELGMTYAQEGQIITYVGAGYDYMRKVSD